MDEHLRQEQEQEQARLNEARKISVVNVNPTNIRPHSDTPEIRKYKKRFNSEILCAALWGESKCFLTLYSMTVRIFSLCLYCLCGCTNLLVICKVTVSYGKALYK